MARKFYTPIDLTGLELTNFKIHNLASDPTPKGEGHAYFNTVDHEIRVYNGTSWMPVGGSVLFGDTASRPSAANDGRLYANTQTGVLYIDNGETWDQIGIGTATTDTLTNKTLDGAKVTGTTSFRNGSDVEYLKIERSGTGTARITAADDLALRAVNDIVLYPGNDVGGHTGKAYIHWGDDAWNAYPQREIATVGTTQVFTNKTINDELYFTNPSTIPNDGGIKVNDVTEEFEIKAYVSNLVLKSIGDDIILNADGDVYKTANDSADNILVTRGDSVTLTNKTLGSTTLLGADLDANEYKIINLANPVDDYDAANKRYVDAATTGLTWKQAVNVHMDSAEVTALGVSVSGSFLTSSIIDGLLVIDGHTLTNADAGYRILVTGTGTNTDGIWVLETVATLNWTASRALDADVFEELKGVAVFVMEGTVYAATSWVQSSHYITDFTDQEWAQFSGQGTYTAGDGISLTGTAFAVNLDSDSLAKSGSGLKVNLFNNGGLDNDGGVYVKTTAGVKVDGSGYVTIDTDVVVRKYATSLTYESGTPTSFTVTHDLGTRDVTVAVYDTTTYEEVITDVVRTSTTVVTVSFAESPASGAFRVVVHA
jgi:hypothetical protein